MTATLDSLGQKLPESLFVFGSEATEMGEAVFKDRSVIERSFGPAGLLAVEY